MTLKSTISPDLAMVGYFLIFYKMQINIPNGFVELPTSLKKKQAFAVQRGLAEKKDTEEISDYLILSLAQKVMVNGSELAKTDWQNFLDEMDFSDYEPLLNACNKLLSGDLKSKKK